MSGEKQQNPDGQEPPEESEKRQRVPYRKALENAFAEKNKEIDCLRKKLSSPMRKVEKQDINFLNDVDAHELQIATEQFRISMKDILVIINQDKNGVLEKIELSEARETLTSAVSLIKKIKLSQIDKLSATRGQSLLSCRTRSSARSTSSSEPLRAIAEAAAARESANYERLIAERQLKLKQRQAEEQKQRAE